MKLPIDGGRRCERVRIRVTSAPIVTFACHCDGCRRMASSAFSLTALFAADAFVVTKGEPVPGGLRSPELAHFFCAHCMTWMFTRPAQLPHVVNVRPTMLDEHAWFAPFAETFTKTRLPWAVTGAVHSFEEFPPMEAFDGLVKGFAARHT